MSHGYSLIELVVVLGLAALLTSIGVPLVHRASDAAAVHGAVSGLTALMAEARVLAVAGGGAQVRLRHSPPVATVTIRDSTVRVLSLGSRERLSVGLPGGRTEWVLHYDPLGIGRVASTTLRIQAGQITRSLIVSAYGRVRRQ